MQSLRQWPLRTVVRVSFLAVVACGVACRRPSAIPSEIPPAIDDGWRVASLEQAGIDRRRLETMTGWIRATPALNVHAVLIERDGHLVYEDYFSGHDERRGRPLGMVTFTRDMTHDIRSVTKSVISALVGIAAGSGAIRSLDTPLLDYFPEYAICRYREAAAHHPARVDDERGARLERERVGTPIQRTTRPPWIVVRIHCGMCWAVP